MLILLFLVQEVLRVLLLQFLDQDIPTGAASTVPGPRGPTGLDGNFGGATFDYTLTSHTGSTPGFSPYGNGVLTYAGPSSTQKMLILYRSQGNDDDGNSITSFMQSFIGNTQSNIKGHVRLSLKGDNSKFLLFIITSVSFSSSNGSYILNVNNVSFSDSNPFSINTDNDLLVSFAMVGTKGEKGDKGVTGADSTVPGPKDQWCWILLFLVLEVQQELIQSFLVLEDPQELILVFLGPRGPTGADSTVPGPRGPTGAASTVPGPRGPTGEPSIVPGPRGPTGADSTVPGPRGPTGAASTVAGPRGLLGSFYCSGS